MKKYIDQSLLFFLFLSGLVTSCTDQDDHIYVLPVKQYVNRTQDFSFWQLDQFREEVQMGYIIKTDDGNIIVIDGGLKKSARIIEDYLVQLGGEVDVWLISHPHKDHIGALSQVITNDRILINKIVHTEIDLDQVQLHEPKNFELIKGYYTVLENSGIEIIDAILGDILVLGDGVELKILGVKNKNIIVNLVNNSSMVFKIGSKSKSILFLGDLGIEGGLEILKNINFSELRADFVQMAHHGQGGVDKSFYEAVGSQYALWPTPDWLWENNLDAKGYNTGDWETFTVRNWMKELNIKKNYVSGIEGTIQID